MSKHLNTNKREVTKNVRNVTYDEQTTEKLHFTKKSHIQFQAG